MKLSLFNRCNIFYDLPQFSKKKGLHFWGMKGFNIAKMLDTAPELHCKLEITLTISNTVVPTASFANRSIRFLGGITMDVFRGIT